MGSRFEVWIRLLNLIKFRFMNLGIFRLGYLAVIFRILFTDGAAFLILSNGLHYNNCTSHLICTKIDLFMVFSESVI